MKNANHYHYFIKNKPRCSPSEPTKAHITTKEFVISFMLLVVSRI